MQIQQYWKIAQVDVNISWVFEIELPLVTNVTNTL